MAIEPAVRNLVTGLAGLTKATQGIICPAVEAEPENEQDCAHNKARVQQPTYGVAGDCKMKQVAAVQVGVAKVKDHRHEDDQDRHFLFSTTQKEGVNECAVDVMRFPHQ